MYLQNSGTSLLLFQPRVERHVSAGIQNTNHGLVPDRSRGIRRDNRECSQWTAVDGRCHRDATRMGGVRGGAALQRVQAWRRSLGCAEAHLQSALPVLGVLVGPVHDRRRAGLLGSMVR